MAKNSKIVYACVAVTTLLAISMGAFAVAQSHESEAGTYTVEFIYDGGSSVQKDIPAGTTINPIREPTLAGYTFTGWFEDMNLTKKFDFSKVINGNLILYGCFVQKDQPIPTYTITFDTRGGSDIPTQHIKAGQTPAYPVPKKELASFVGWFTTPYKAETLDMQGEFHFGPIYNDWVLFAGWKEVESTCTIEFIVDGESTKKDIPVGTTISPPQEPTRSGHLFAGWFEDVNLTRKFDFSQIVSESTVLYGGFTEGNSGVPIKFTISFDSMGGSKVPAQVIDSGKTPTYTIPYRGEDWAFVGWFINPFKAENQDGTGEFQFESPIYNNWILFAGWKYTGIAKAPDYTVVFYTNCEVSMDYVYLDKGDRIPTPKIITQVGFEQLGWFLDREWTKKWNFNNTVDNTIAVDGVISLYLGWETTVYEKYQGPVMASNPKVYIGTSTNAEARTYSYTYYLGVSTDTVVASLTGDPIPNMGGTSVTMGEIDIVGTTVTQFVSKTIASGSSTTTIKESGSTGDVLSVIGSTMGMFGILPPPAGPIATVLGGVFSIAGILTPEEQTSISNWNSTSMTTGSSSAITAAKATALFKGQEFKYVNLKDYVGYFVVGSVEYMQTEVYSFDGRYLGSYISYNTFNCDTKWLTASSKEAFHKEIISPVKISLDTIHQDHKIFVQKMRAEIGDSVVVVSSVDDLSRIRYEPGRTYALVNTIDLKNYGATWNAIPSFNGEFYGNGHAILNMNISSTASTYSSNLNLGLFGSIGKAGTVKDLSLVDARITVKSTHDGSGFISAGAISGYNAGTIDNCSVYDCYIEINRNKAYTGSIVGESDGTITNCRAIHPELFSNADMGGIVGKSTGKVTKCLVTGNEKGYALLTLWGSKISRSLGGLVGYGVGAEITESTVLNTKFVYKGDNLKPCLGFIVGYIEGGEIKSVACDWDHTPATKASYYMIEKSCDRTYVFSKWYGGYVSKTTRVV